MIWLYVLLGMAFCVLLCFYLLRFDYLLAISYPGEVKGRFRFSFLWIKRGGGFSTSTGPSFETQESDSVASERMAVVQSAGGQAGFLRLPDFPGLRRRFKRGAFKFATDLEVLGALVRFGARCAGFFGHALRARLRFLGLGVEDPVVLGYLAGGYSALSGFYPGLRCPVHYYFNQSRISFGMKVRGRFNGLHIIAALVRCFLAFPWIFLTARFIGSVRDTTLTWWREKLFDRLASG